MRRIRWLSSAGVIAIHNELIVRYGGLWGLRAHTSLESALARPKHLAADRPHVTVPELAAGYSWGLLRSHPFVDGNKRIALAAMVVFLQMNDWELTCSEAEETAMVLRAPAGDINETAWVAWVVRNARKKR